MYFFRSAPAEAGDNLARFRRGEKQDGLPPRGLPVCLTHKKPALAVAVAVAVVLTIALSGCQVPLR